MINIHLSTEEALVLFEWLARKDDAEFASTLKSAEQKVLWVVESQLEKQIAVFSSDYKLLVEQALIKVDNSR